jgi:indole-3-glycerol phosphate synthase
MSDFLDVLAADAKTTVDSGYYQNIIPLKSPQLSLRKAIIQTKNLPIIAEVKGASPSRGTIRQNFAPEEIAQAMVRGGAAGISVLTEPKHFKGSIENLTTIRETVGCPILMKDIIMDPEQLDAASKVGANAVLLIQAIFDRGYCRLSLDEMVAKAHSNNLEVLLETHNPDEFSRATKTKADLVGINNRNLGTLKVDLNVTKNILANCSCGGKVVVSESGINTAMDLSFLRECGAQAFLIGSAVMSSKNVEAKVKEFVNS